MISLQPLHCKQAKVMFGLQSVKSKLTGDPQAWSSEVNNRVPAATAGPSFSPRPMLPCLGTKFLGTPSDVIEHFYLLTLCVNLVRLLCPDA